MASLIYLLFLALLGSIIALSGGVIFLFNRRLSQILEEYSIPFAAGVLITVALIGLLPEATELIGERAFLIVLISFMVSYLFENFLFGLHHHNDTGHHSHRIESSVALVLVGDTIHNFIDGIAIGVSYLVNPGLGLITSLSTFLHEVPHEIGDFGILLKAGWKRSNVLIANTISASMTIVGALLIYFVRFDDSFVGGAIAVASGIFLYLGAIDFMPHLLEHTKNKHKVIVPLVLGIFVMVGALMVIPHSHDSEDEHESGVENVEVGR